MFEPRYVHLKLWKTEAVAQSCSAKKGILGNFEKFTGNHLCQRHFFNKVAGLRRFPVNFVKFLRTTVFTEHLRWLLLRRVISHHFSSKDRDSVFIIFFIIQVKQNVL